MVARAESGDDAQTMPKRWAGAEDRTAEHADSRQDRRPGEDRRHGDRPEEHAVAKQRNGGRPDSGAGEDRPEDADPKGIEEPGRNRNLPGLLSIDVAV